MSAIIFLFLFWGGLVLAAYGLQVYGERHHWGGVKICAAACALGILWGLFFG